MGLHPHGMQGRQGLQHPHLPFAEILLFTGMLPFERIPLFTEVPFTGLPPLSEGISPHLPAGTAGAALTGTPPQPQE